MGSFVQYKPESDMKNSMKMLKKQTKMKMTLPPFQKEPFLPIPNNIAISNPRLIL